MAAPQQKLCLSKTILMPALVDPKLAIVAPQQKLDLSKTVAPSLVDPKLAAVAPQLSKRLAPAVAGPMFSNRSLLTSAAIVAPPTVDQKLSNHHLEMPAPIHVHDRPSFLAEKQRREDWNVMPMSPRILSYLPELDGRSRTSRSSQRVIPKSDPFGLNLDLRQLVTDSEPESEPESECCC